MGWFSRKPTPEKQIEAAITVATNLYLHTIPGAEDAPVALQFSLADSRYRYLLFCLSAVITTTLAYDEKRDIQADTLVKGCLQFATWAVIKNPQDYLNAPSAPNDAVSNSEPCLKEFLKQWSIWPVLEKEGKNGEINDLLCSMIHTTESDAPATHEDMKRLEELALQIHCRMPTMRGAFIELIKR